MRKNRLISIFVIVLLILVACREEEPLPTPVPTITVPTPVPSATPFTTESGTETAVATPAPVQIDPEEIDWPPQVLYSSPTPGEEVLLDGAITIRFDQPMNQQAVENAFAITPAGGDEKVSGNFSWPRPDTVIFTPQSDYQRRQTYRVQIDETAESANGLTLELPVELLLQTVGALEVSQVIPADGSIDVQTDGAITVLFNRPVVPLVSSGQQTNLPQPLNFDPPVSGQGEWTSTSIYRFVPDEPLAGATTYRIAIDDALTDLVGVGLEQPFSAQFTTLNPDIVTVQPDSTADLIPTAPITITFNMPMDRATTEAALSLSNLGEGTDAALNFEWLENDRVLQMTPQNLLELDSAYQLLIDSSARAANGEASLGESESFVYATVPFPGIIRTVPAAGGVPERFQRGIVVQFASPMNWDTVEGNIRIDPEPARMTTFVNQFSNEITLDFNLELNTNYTVVVPGFVADPYGNTLGEPYTFRFTTPGRAPIASLGLPPRLSQFSTSFSSNVNVIHVNVSRLDLSLYELGLPLNLLNRPYDVTDYRPAASPIRTWSLPQDAPRDEVQTVTVPLAGEGGGSLTPGIYLLTVDAPETNEEVRFWQNQRNLLLVADTNVVVKEMFGAVHVWVTDLQTGQPVSGRNLTLYSEQGVSLGTAVSDNNGFAQFDYNPTNDFLEGATVVSGQPGQAGFGIGSSIWDEGIRPWEFDVPASSGDEVDTLTYIYTDRPIYRPGDTVHFKGIVRNTNYGRYTQPNVTNLDLRLGSFNFFGGEPFERTLPVQVGPDGSFSGEYQLPADLALGTYQFYVQSSTVEAFRQFTVAEYRTPEFLVNMTPDAPEQLRGESVTVALSAEYFFGGPATDLPVEWTVYEEAYQPTPSSGPFYSFGDAGGFLFEDPGFFGGFGGGGAFGSYLINGNGRTDENGRLLIELPADLLQDVDEGSRIITVEANVLDLSEFPVSSRARVVLHAAETYVGIQPDDFIGRAGSEAIVNLQTLDWDGRSVPSQPVEVVFYRREWVPNRTQDFGVYYTRWDTVDTEVARASVTTNAQGQAAASFTPEEGGTFIAVATVTDADGREQFSSTTIWVADSGQIGWQIDPRDKSMTLTPDNTSYAPGDTARVLIQSPFTEPVRAWLTIERGQLLEQRVITVNGSSDVLEIPITAAMSPNAFVTVTAIKGVTDGRDRYPEMRLGIAELPVSTEQQALTVTLTPQQETFEPGDTAVYTINVTDYQGNPVQADVSLALVDLAVLTLKDDNAPDILDAFYAEQPYRSRLGSGLIVSGESYPIEIPVEQLGFGGGGGGEVADTALARGLGDDDEGVRQDFPDTAFWQASLTTDADGQATIEIPLPDNLTTWRLSSKAVTPDTLVGQNSVDIITTLPLLVRPVTPRFFTVGDVVELGAIVNNNTDEALETAVSLQANGVILSGESTQTITVPANGQRLVRWPVTVENVAGVDLTFRVEGGDYSDASKPTFSDGGDIPVYRYTGSDVVATAGQLDEAGRRVEAILLPPGVDPTQGEVAITLSPSLAAALMDSIQLNNETEYATLCTYAVTDRLLPNAALLNLAQQLPAASLDAADVAESEAIVKTSVAQLEQLVLADGGWGWCSSVESDLWLTAYALFGLAQARELGYTVQPSVLENAANYLVVQLVSPSPQLTAFEVNRQAFFLYVLAQLNPNIVADLDRLVDENRSLLDPYARALVALAYADLGIVDDRVETLLNDLNDSAVVSATGTHWQDASRDFRNLNSDVRGTAVVLRTLAELDPDNPLLPGAVRWLMSARTAQLWSTSHETAWTLLSLTEWMVATGELDANYDYSLEVNLQAVTDGRFTTSTVTNSRNLSLPIGDLLLEDANFFNFGRGVGDGRLYYTMHLESSIDMSFISPVNRGVSVERVYYDAECDPETETCQPITEIEAGQQVRVVLTVIAENDLVYAMIEDPIPAGTEAIDPGLNINSPTQGGEVNRVDEDYRYGYWGWWYFNQIEYRDEQVVFLANFLPAGTYQYSYFLQATIPGEYQVRPTFARQTFFPEVNGRSAGLVFKITQ
ncbi:MAG: Ig-like domain-containing protein [Ardenticatenaceae bacterium]|nr:Ig-like domain-containing protein [Ardenticatenaceae bacterium]